MNNKKLNFQPNIPGEQSINQQGINLNLAELSNLKCPHCGNQVFQQLFIAKKISALQSPSGKEGIAPLQIFACTNCGAVPVEFGGNLLEKDEQTTTPPPSDK